MDINMTLQSASCDLQIAEGHNKNQNFDGMKKCLDAAATRIDDVTNYAIQIGMDVPTLCMTLMLKCIDLYDDLRDWEEMIAHFQEISTCSVNASNYHERHKFFPGVM